MQFKHYSKDKKYNYDCASCKGKDHKCLLHNTEVTVGVTNMIPIVVTRDDWYRAVEAYEATPGHSDAEIFMALRYLNLCPVPLFTELSIELWTLFNALGGFQNLRTPQEYYDLPALYVQGVHIISAELNRLEAYGNVSG